MLKKLDSEAALREAGLATSFMWQDQAMAGETDGVGEVEYGTVIGTLKDMVHGSPVFLIHIQGSATSEFGYSYEVEETVTVRLTLKGEDELVPITAVATEEEIKQAEQHGRDLACKEYADLIHIAEVGAYSEGLNGEYWYPAEEDGVDISARLIELESRALEEKLHFAKQSDGTYKLEPATQEELAAYAEAKARAEEQEDEEGDV